MEREEVYRDIEREIGVVPSWLKRVPDSSLGLEWKLLKKVELEPGPIPGKYRELIGVAISGVTKCRYCSFYHTEMARLAGASEEEIEDALHFAKSSVGWSAYINGLQVDFGRFREEVLEIVAHERSKERYR
jgi:AhpD family alkylhydroperoxidase